jgi:ribosome assembly protein 1
VLEKVTKSLAITLPPYIARSREPKAILQTLFAAYLPLSTAVLVSVMEYLPSPPDAQAARLPELLDESLGAKAIKPIIRDAIINFRTDKNAPVVAYISKMIAIPKSEISTSKTKFSSTTLTPEEAREIGSEKRAEIAKAQAEAKAEAKAEAEANDDPCQLPPSTAPAAIPSGRPKRQRGSIDHKTLHNTGAKRGGCRQ